MTARGDTIEEEMPDPFRTNLSLPQRMRYIAALRRQFTAEGRTELVAEISAWLQEEGDKRMRLAEASSDPGGASRLAASGYAIGKLAVELQELFGSGEVRGDADP